MFKTQKLPQSRYIPEPQHATVQNTATRTSEILIDVQSQGFQDAAAYAVQGKVGSHLPQQAQIARAKTRQDTLVGGKVKGMASHNLQSQKNRNNRMFQSVVLMSNSDDCSTSNQLSEYNSRVQTAYLTSHAGTGQSHQSTFLRLMQTRATVNQQTDSKQLYTGQNTGGLPQSMANQGKRYMVHSSTTHKLLNANHTHTSSSKVNIESSLRSSLSYSRLSKKQSSMSNGVMSSQSAKSSSNVYKPRPSRKLLEQLGQMHRSEDELKLLQMKNVFPPKKQKNLSVIEASQPLGSLQSGSQTAPSSFVKDHLAFEQTAVNTTAMILAEQSKQQSFVQPGSSAAPFQTTQQVLLDSAGFKSLIAKEYQVDTSMQEIDGPSEDGKLRLARASSQPDLQIAESGLATRNVPNNAVSRAVITEQIEHETNHTQDKLIESGKHTHDSGKQMLNMKSSEQMMRLSIPKAQATPQTVSERPRLKSGITFGKNVKIESTLGSLQGVAHEGTRCVKTANGPKRSSLLTKDSSKRSKSRSRSIKTRSHKSIQARRAERLALKEKEKRKEAKQTEWPSEKIADLFAKPNLKYTKPEQLPEPKPKKKVRMFDESSDSFKSTHSSQRDKSTSPERPQDIFKQTDKQIDKVFAVPFGEIKASERIKYLHKLKQNDIGRARRNAEIEIKFREWYQGKQQPNEFKILPGEGLIFDDHKAILNVIELCDKCKHRNEQGTAKPKKRTNSNSVLSRGVTLQSSCNCCQPNVVGNPKQSQVSRPGQLSNNWRKSNLMKYINKEYAAKMRKLQRIEHKKQHYMQSPTRGHSVPKSIESASMGESSLAKDSFTAELLHPGVLPGGMNKCQSVDSGASRKVKSPFKDKRESQETHKSSSPLKNTINKKSTLLNSKFGKNKNFHSSRTLLVRPKPPQTREATFQKQVRNFVTHDMLQFKNFAGVNLSSDPIHTTQRLYKSVMFEALKRAKVMYSSKQYEASTELLKSVIPLAQYALELLDTLMLHKLIAEIEYQRKAYNESLQYCHLVVYMCCSNDWLADLRLQSLKLAALCRMRLKEYPEAIHQLKLCFEHCLRTGNAQVEVEVYEQLSYCFLYMGQVKQAEYFNTRFRMGILEEADSQARTIYASLRKNINKSNERGSWEHKVQYVSDVHWAGENIFDSFHANFLHDCRYREKICRSLVQGRTLPTFERHRCNLSKRLAVALLAKVGKLLRKIERRQVPWPDMRFCDLHLEDKWRNSYYLEQRREDCEDIVQLRMLIFKTCQQNLLSNMLDEELQHELDLIGDYIASEDKKRLDYQRTMSAYVRGSHGETQAAREQRLIKIPKVGTIGMREYDLPEMPLPNMVNIDAARFDFRNSVRNASQRAGKQYVSLGLTEICPHLFTKKFKKQPVPRQMHFDEEDQQLPGINDPSYRENLMQRATARKANKRDTIFLSHLSTDRTVSGKFKSEIERKIFFVRHFEKLETLWTSDMQRISGKDPLDSHGRRKATQGEEKQDPDMVCYHERISNIDLKQSRKRQSLQAQLVLTKCLPIRAFIYGQDLVEDLIKNHNKMVKVRREKYEQAQLQQGKDPLDFEEEGVFQKRRPDPTRLDLTQAKPTGPQANTMMYKGPSHKPVGENMRTLFLNMSKRPGMGTITTKAATKQTLSHSTVRFRSKTKNITSQTEASSYALNQIMSEQSAETLSKRETDSEFQDSFIDNTFDGDSSHRNDKSPRSSSLQPGFENSAPKHSTIRRNSQSRFANKQSQPIKIQLTDVIYEEENEVTAKKTFERPAYLDNAQYLNTIAEASNDRHSPSSSTATFLRLQSPIALRDDNGPQTAYKNKARGVGTASALTAKSASNPSTWGPEQSSSGRRSLEGFEEQVAGGRNQNLNKRHSMRGILSGSNSVKNSANSNLHLHRVKNN